jgi:hypothetical protein
MFTTDAAEKVGRDRLAVEMDGEHGLDLLSARPFQNGIDCRRVQIERGRVNIGQHGGGPGAQNGAYGGEEAEWRGDDGIARAYSGGRKRKPEGVRAGGTAKGVSDAELFGCRFLEYGYRLAQDELLGFKHVTDSFQKLLLQGSVLAFEVQHGNRLGGLSGRAMGGQRLLHAFILPVVTTRVTRGRRGASKKGRAETAAEWAMKAAKGDKRRNGQELCVPLFRWLDFGLRVCLKDLTFNDSGLRTRLNKPMAVSNAGLKRLVNDCNVEPLRGLSRQLGFQSRSRHFGFSTTEIEFQRPRR